MEEIDSSDSDATVNYGAEPPEIQNLQSPRNLANDVEDANILAVPVQLVEIMTQTATQDDIIKPPSCKKR